MLVIIIVGVLAFFLGWTTCAIVSIGKRTDLEWEIMALKNKEKKNKSLQK